MKTALFVILAMLGVVQIKGGGVAPGEPTLSAHFIASPIQGTTCVAPCAVHFDAIGTGTSETVDSFYTRPFHSLDYRWNFGDPKSGYWRIGALAHGGFPSPKNLDKGPIAGHVYTEDGVYTVTLTVTNPSGTTDEHTEVITVVAPEDTFSTANTYCFATDGLDWNGCPLDCTTSDNCTVVDGSPTFSQALLLGDGCGGGTEDCADADAGKRWIVLRKGDTFTLTGSNDLYFTGDSPAMISAFGNGARPVITSAGAEMRLGRHWTASGIEMTRSDGISQYGGQQPGLGVGPDGRRDGILWYDSKINFSNSCIQFATTVDGTTFHNLWAFVDVICNGDGTGSNSTYSNWLFVERFLWMGLEFSNDIAGAYSGAPNALAGLRTSHVAWGVWAHNDWYDLGREAFSIRSYDDRELVTADYESNKWLVMRDQWVEENGSVGNEKFCQDSGCNCGDSNCVTDGDPLTGWIAGVHDVIFEDNFTFYDNRGPVGRFALLVTEGSDFTIRNNIWDLQGGQSGVGFAIVRAGGYPISYDGGNPREGNIHVYNNTVFADDAFAFNATSLLEGTGSPQVGCVTGCYSRNNLFVWPNYTGDTTPNDAASVTSSNNLLFTTEKFQATVPEAGLTGIGSFRIVSTTGATFPRDEGYDFVAATDTDRWVFDDIAGQRRADGAWDVGAWEYGADDWNANEFHVATAVDTPPGSNSNNGTLDLPWLTIDYAFDTGGVGRGDELWLHEGFYDQQISTETTTIVGGTSWDNRLLIGGWPGSASNDAVLLPTGVVRTVFLEDSNASYIELYNLDIDGTYSTSDTVKITCGGVGCDSAGTNASNHIRLVNSSVHNGAQGILVTGIGSTNNEFINMDVYANGSVQNLDHGIYIASDSNLVKGGTYHSNAASGIVIYDGSVANDPDNNIVTETDVYSNGTAGPTTFGVQMCGSDNSATLNILHSHTTGPSAAGANLFYNNDVVTPASCASINGIVRYNWIYGNNNTVTVVPGATGSVTTPNVLLPP